MQPQGGTKDPSGVEGALRTPETSRGSRKARGGANNFKRLAARAPATSLLLMYCIAYRLVIVHFMVHLFHALEYVIMITKIPFLYAY